MDRMTKLLNKIERRLGTRALNLPDFLSKDTWAENVIATDTIPTFSRFFPNKFLYEVHQEDKKGDYYIIRPEVIPQDIEILGVKDIAWDQPDSLGYSPMQPQSYSFYDTLNSPYTMDDIAFTQLAADELSLFNNGIYLDFKEPNMISVHYTTGFRLYLPKFKVYLLLEHASNLSTIPPTQMEVFEKLAIADVANYLYKELKVYEGTETIFVSMDMKLDDLANEAQKRDDIVGILQDNYVSASNSAQPILFTV